MIGSAIVVVNKSKKSIEALLALRGFFMFAVTILTLNFYSTENLIVTGTRELMLCLGFCFAREILYIQLAHVTDTKYSPLWLLNGLILITPCLIALANTFLSTNIPEYQTIAGLALLSGLGYCHMAYSVANEIADELKINIFRINKVKGN